MTAGAQEILFDTIENEDWLYLVESLDGSEQKREILKWVDRAMRGLSWDVIHPGHT